MQIRERYVIAIETLGFGLLVGALVYAIGLVPTFAIITALVIIFFAQIAKTR